MKKIALSYSDGVYYFNETEEPYGIEIPETTLALWYSILDLNRVMQKQLSALDDTLDDQTWENSKALTGENE